MSHRNRVLALAAVGLFAAPACAAEGETGSTTPSSASATSSSRPSGAPQTRIDVPPVLVPDPTDASATLRCPVPSPDCGFPNVPAEPGPLVPAPPGIVKPADAGAIGG